MTWSRGSPKVCSCGKVRGTIGWVITVVCGIYRVCHPPEEGNNVVWRRLVETWVCCNLGVVLLCVVRVGGGRVIPLFPVPSPSSGMGMMLGTGASFGEVFVLVAEASVIAGTGSGGSCGTNCGDLHPLTRACQSRTWVSGFLGGLWGAHPLGSVVGLQQTRVG